MIGWRQVNNTPLEFGPGLQDGRFDNEEAVTWCLSPLLVAKCADFTIRVPLDAILCKVNSADKMNSKKNTTTMPRTVDEVTRLGRDKNKDVGRAFLGVLGA